VNEPPRLLHYFLPLTVGLALLFAVLGPPTTASLPFWQAWLHWWLHVSVGLALAMVAASVLGRQRRLAALPLPVFLLLSGVLGALMFAPVAMFLESWLPQTPELGPPDRLDQWEARGGAHALLAEALQMAPSYLASWFLVNAAPVLAGRAASPATSLEPAATSPSAPEPPAEADSTGPRQDPLARLPPAIGRDLVSISSDLHYLQVVTTRGRATVLGSLNHVESDLAGQGVRLHRAHWVALAHVRRLLKSERGWRCELRDGRRLPVSRRRIGEVRSRLGRDFVVEEPT
jgi:hypothetical protein